MNTFHVTLTVGTDKTTWSHPTRDLALARVTALFVRESQLSVFERQHNEFTPTARVQHTVFELEPMSMAMSALDALDEANYNNPKQNPRYGCGHKHSEHLIDSGCQLWHKAGDRRPTMTTRNPDDPNPKPVPTAKLGEIQQPHVVNAFAQHTAGAVIQGFSAKALNAEAPSAEPTEEDVANLRVAVDAWKDAENGRESIAIRLHRVINQIRASRTDPPNEARNWRKGVLETNDKLYAAKMSGVELSWAKIFELINILLQHPPESNHD